MVLFLSTTNFPDNVLTIVVRSGSCFSSASCAVKELKIEKRIDLGGTDEIVFRYPLDCVRHVGDGGLVIAQGDVRMMVLAVRNPRSGVNKRHGLVVVLELEGLLHQTVLELPARQALEHVTDLRLRHRRNTTLAGLAFLANQSIRYLAHDLSPKANFDRRGAEYTEKDEGYIS